MPTYRLTLEYDGTNFVGWQTQPNGRSVQQEVERALRQILQREVSIVGGGRTDAGVHARGQVASTRLEAPIDCVAMTRSLNGLLPEDIVVRTLDHAAEEFHARYSATSRRYRYQIVRTPIAVGRQYAWQVTWPLDTDKMKACAAQVIGEHDFQSFCKHDTATPHFRCMVKRASWEVVDQRLLFDIEANRFLYGMVRALVGTMVNVGRGYTPLEQFAEIMARLDRKAAGMAAPPQGLVLESISYE